MFSRNASLKIIAMLILHFDSKEKENDQTSTLQFVNPSFRFKRKRRKIKRIIMTTNKISFCLSILYLIKSIKNYHPYGSMINSYVSSSSTIEVEYSVASHQIHSIGLYCSLILRCKSAIVSTFPYS